TRFFYNPASLTFDDGNYLRATERIANERTISDMDAARVLAPDPFKVAIETAIANGGYTVKQGMQALSVIYRLADQFPPGTPDGDILLRATRELLRELSLILGGLSSGAMAILRDRFKAQLDWFNGPFHLPEAAHVPPNEPANTNDVQGGILTGYDNR